MLRGVMTEREKVAEGRVVTERILNHHGAITVDVGRDVAEFQRMVGIRFSLMCGVVHCEDLLILGEHLPSVQCYFSNIENKFLEILSASM